MNFCHHADAYRCLVKSKYIIYYGLILPVSLVVAVDVENIDDLTVSEVFWEGFKVGEVFRVVGTMGE